MHHLEYLLENGYIDVTDINVTLNEENEDEGQRIAKELGVVFKGWWKELGKFIFNDDDVTESSFTAKDMAEAKKKLHAMRAKFGMA